jgi:hypothetical protein
MCFQCRSFLRKQVNNGFLHLVVQISSATDMALIKICAVVFHDGELMMHFDESYKQVRDDRPDCMLPEIPYYGQAPIDRLWRTLGWEDRLPGDGLKV